MPYRSRMHTAGVTFHVFNRGVRRMRLFNTTEDYAAALRVLAEAQHRVPLRVFAYCLMPTHFHFVVQPLLDGQLSSFMRWFTATHSKRWHAHRGTTGSGYVYQSRFKAFAIEHGRHFLTVCRYVERNPLRAELVNYAHAWPWSSLSQRWTAGTSVGLAEWPVPRPDDWIGYVNEQEPASELLRLRDAVRRNLPLGSGSWTSEIAKVLNLNLNGRGRPLVR